MKSTRQSAHLFISYSRTDRIAVDKLVGDLRSRGYALWMDVDDRGIEPGEDWRRELEAQMSAAEGVVACVSPDFLGSPFCHGEIEQAQREGKPIFPVLVRRLDAAHTLADFGLDHVQYTDLTLDYNVGLRKLLVALPKPKAPLRSAMRIGAMLAGGLITIALIYLLVSGAVIGGIGSVQPTITPLPPTPTVALQNYDIGVLVSYFTVDPPGALSQSEAEATIERFSKALDTQLGANLGKSDLNLSYKLDGPSGIPPITGADTAARRENAAALLNSRGAKVAIYGLIHYDPVLKQAQLEPEFYVAADRFFTDAQDMTGSYAFGKNIPVDLLDDRGKLGARITALSYVMTGLFQHMTLHYDSALTSYQAALAVPKWDDQDGKEVLYALIGSSQMKLAEQAARRCQRDTVLARTDDAEKAFQASQQIANTVRPDFARASAGLANVYAVRALWLPPENDGCTGNAQKLNVEALQKAAAYIDEYHAKLNPLDEDPGIQRKLLLTEVQVRFLLWAGQTRQQRADPNNAQFQAFQTAISRIIKGYDNRSDSAWAFPVMEAYIFRGQASYALGKPRDALEDYDKALAVYDDPKNTPLLAPERAMTVHGWKGDALFQLGNYAQAADEYGRALSIAQALKSADTLIANYKARQARADQYSTATPTRPAPTVTPVPTATPASTDPSRSDF